MKPALTIVLFSFALFFLASACSNNNAVECQGNCYSGFGIKKWKDGGYIKGNWKNGELVGYGKEYFGSTSEFAGDTYVGEFDVGGYNGYGTYDSKMRGGTQVGFWKNSKPNGYSKIVFRPHFSSAIKSYQGNWKDGKYDGYGEIVNGDTGTYANDRYKGGFANGFFDGAGIYYYADGSRYEGSFRKGFKEGKGTFYFVNGSKYEGVWVHDESKGLENFKQAQPLTNYISTEQVYYAYFKPGAGSSTPMKQVKNSKGLFTIRLYSAHIAVTKGRKLTNFSIRYFKTFADSKRYYLFDDLKNHFQISISADANHIKNKKASIEFIELDDKDHPRWIYEIAATSN